MSNIWVVRAGREAAFIDLFVEKGVMLMGMSPLIGAEAIKEDRKALMTRTAKAHPDWSKPRVANHAGQLFRFLSEISVKEEVATYDPFQRCYLLGKVQSVPRYDKALDQEHPFVRSVTWDRKILRDALTVGSRNSLGAIQTIFRLGQEVSEELRKKAIPIEEVAPTAPPPPPEEEDVEEAVSMAEKSSTAIEDRITRLDSEQMQDLMAGVLRAMGYKTRVSPRGADRGVDIFASPDGLGLEEPRIFVEVKHRPSVQMGSADLRAFLGGRKPGDRCLYLSTGGFTKDARYEAERSNVPLELITLPGLRALVVDNYDALDPETKRLIPLRRLYWPVADA